MIYGINAMCFINLQAAGARLECGFSLRVSNFGFIPCNISSDNKLVYAISRIHKNSSVKT